MIECGTGLFMSRWQDKSLENEGYKGAGSRNGAFGYRVGDGTRGGDVTAQCVNSLYGPRELTICDVYLGSNLIFISDRDI